MKFSTILTTFPLLAPVVLGAALPSADLEVREPSLGEEALFDTDAALSRRGAEDLLDLLEMHALVRRGRSPSPSPPKTGANAPSIPSSPTIDKPVQGGRVIADDKKAVGVHSGAPSASGAEADFLKGMENKGAKVEGSKAPPAHSAQKTKELGQMSNPVPNTVKAEQPARSIKSQTQTGFFSGDPKESSKHGGLISATHAAGDKTGAPGRALTADQKTTGQAPKAAGAERAGEKVAQGQPGAHDPARQSPPAGSQSPKRKAGEAGIDEANIISGKRQRKGTKRDLESQLIGRTLAARANTLTRVNPRIGIPAQGNRMAKRDLVAMQSLLEGLELY